MCYFLHPNLLFKDLFAFFWKGAYIGEWFEGSSKYRSFSQKRIGCFRRGMLKTVKLYNKRNFSCSFIFFSLSFLFLFIFLKTTNHLRCQQQFPQFSECVMSHRREGIEPEEESVRELFEAIFFVIFSVSNNPLSDSSWSCQIHPMYMNLGICFSPAPKPYLGTLGRKTCRPKNK